MSFRVATYNVWHGLSGAGLLRFGELEPKGRKQLRADWQFRALSPLNLDVLFLQEVNPLLSGARLYAQKLGLEECHQLDQVGLEVMGYGFPTNLKTGLCTLTAPELRQSKVGGFRLSGSRVGWLSEKVSFQTGEFRYALVSRVQFGRNSLCLVNVHLHHGPGLTKQMIQELDSLVEMKAVPKEKARAALKEIEAGIDRRRLEIERLVELIQAHSGVSENIIVAGDFNAEEDELGLLDRLDLVDATARIKEVSWSPEENQVNHGYSRGLDLPVSDRGEPALKDFIKRSIHSPYMLDHIFVSKGLSNKVRASRRICDVPDGDLLGSDHFGLMIELDID